MPVVKVKVTEKHIENGRSYSPNSCPVALAMKDAGILNPIVGYSMFNTEKYWQAEHRLPKVANDFIEKFDDDEPVCPIVFNVRVRKEEMA